MALITCSECTKSYSDKADACPSCGCPTSFQSAADAQKSPKSPPNTPTSNISASPTTRAPSSTVNNGKRIGGIIAIGAGALIALSSGLITGSDKSSYGFESGGYSPGYTWRTDTSKTDGEQLAANGFIALGMLLIIGGAASLMTDIGKSVYGSNVKGSLGANVAPDRSQDKTKLYSDLIFIIYNDKTLSGLPSLSESELINDELTIRTRDGDRICSFKKVCNNNGSSQDFWALQR